MTGMGRTYLLAVMMISALLLSGCKGAKKQNGDKDISNLPKEEQLKEYNKQTMRSLPMPLAEGIVMQKVEWEDSMEVYYYSINQKIVDRSLVMENAKHFQTHPEELLNMGDPDVETMVGLLYELRMGLEYRYVFSDDKDTVSVVYPREALRNFYAVDLLKQAVQ